VYYKYNKRKQQGGNEMKKFEIGKEYSCRSICDHECVWTYTVIARTAQTITITDGKEAKKLRIIKNLSEINDTESVYPSGKYSMCPILRA
jgi:hypothetical protein